MGREESTTARVAKGLMIVAGLAWLAGLLVSFLVVWYSQTDEIAAGRLDLLGLILPTLLLWAAVSVPFAVAMVVLGVIWFAARG